jgi:hypothetical protein
MMRLSNLVIWIPVGAILGHLLFGVIQQKQHLAEVVDQLEAFQQKGPRFTAADGDELCEDVRKLQEYVGLPERECAFNE